MSLFVDLAWLAEELAGEAARLKKRAAIVRGLEAVVTGVAVDDREAPVGAVAGAVEDAAIEDAAVEFEQRERWIDAGRFAMYLAGTPFAEADSRKLNAGGALLSKAVLAVTGATDAALGVAYRRHGDMGAAAFDLLQGRAPEVGTLTLMEVEDAFVAMAVARTTAVRAALVEGLLGLATAIEAKYLLKLMLGDMRIGVKQSLVEEAIAVAATAVNLDRPVEVGAVRHAVMLEADLAGALVRAFEGTLPEARMRLFHPLGFMLASPVETPEEAVERFTAKPAKVAVVKVKKPRRGKKGASVDSDAGSDRDTTMLEEESLEIAEDAGKVGSADAHLSRDKAAAKMGHPGLLPEDAAAEIEYTGLLSDGLAGGGDATGGRVEAFLEDKYDGMRAQVHCGDPEQAGRVAIYSRNREDVTESFPELAEAFAAAAVPVGAVIFDGEILGWDFETGQALPFAVLGQRIGRKRVTNEWRVKVPVVFMAFDLMYADGGLQLELPLRERRNRLEAVVEAMVETARAPMELAERGMAKLSQGLMFEADAADEMGEERGLERLMISPSRLVETAEEIDRAYGEARARANEGVMLKAAGSAYLPGRRGLAWVKLKRELATLDVVITGAEYGNGRRAAFLSDYTFAVRGPGGELLNVGKAYSGVTDAEIAELTEWLKEHTLEDFGHFRTVEPQIILEVAFNNVMRSGRHASGFALRFPRIIRIRSDKPVEEIDTVERVEEVYQSQVDKPMEV
jgi:DNA ligase-1